VEFDSYVRLHSWQLLRLATFLARDHASAEDIVQEVLIRAHRRWSMIATLPHPHAYLRRMVVNESTSWRRKWGRVEPRPDPELDRHVSTDSEQVADHDELLAELAKLAPKIRAALILRYFEDLPDNEIAELLGCRTGTVRGYVHRGLKALRIELSPDPRPTEAASATALSTRKAQR
jgi:RNA polymerase sigma-70 factor (sigma-E family)